MIWISLSRRSAPSWARTAALARASRTIAVRIAIMVRAVSKDQFQGELNLPRRPGGSEDAKPAAVGVQAADGREIRLVQQIECLRPELHVPRFLEAEVLVHSEVGLIKGGHVRNVSGRISERLRVVRHAERRGIQVREGIASVQVNGSAGEIGALGNQRTHLLLGGRRVADIE